MILLMLSKMGAETGIPRVQSNWIKPEWGQDEEVLLIREVLKGTGRRDVAACLT